MASDAAERHVPTERGLYALALLSIACGHQAVGDESLAQTEIDEATQLVQRWKPQATPAEVGRVLAKAMEIYRSIGTEADAGRRARACAELVRREFPPPALALILGDLREIIAADGLMSPAEGDFVDAVRDVFVHG